METATTFTIELLDTIASSSKGTQSPSTPIADAVGFIQMLWERYWPHVLAACVMVATFTSWVKKAFEVQKLRLEIKKLQQEAEVKNVSPIVRATLEEIAKYSQTTNDSRKIRRMMHEGANEILEKIDANEDVDTKSLAQALILQSESVHSWLLFINMKATVVAVAAIYGSSYVTSNIASVVLYATGTYVLIHIFAFGDPRK